MNLLTIGFTILFEEDTNNSITGDEIKKENVMCEKFNVYTNPLKNPQRNPNVIPIAENH